MNSSSRNKRLVGILLIAVIAMGAVAYASVPLYRMFCSVTGYGGTTQRAEVAPTQTRERWVTVSFDTNVDSNLPWDFKADVPKIQAKLGETYTANFHAHNRSDKTLTGMATFNVQPDKAGSYFSKLQCFCFDRQVLKPGQTAKLAVQFYVDPAMADDKNTDDVQNITLSYTFFKAKDQKISGDLPPTSNPSQPQPKPSGNPL